MIDDILTIDQFASNEDCATIIDGFTRCRPTCAGLVGDGFFNNRVMWASSYPREETKVRDTLRKLAHKSTVEVSQFFNETPIYCDGIQTVIWNGPAMPPHQDDRHPDPKQPHGTPWRFIASVIYLNNDYEGGEIYFPERSISIKPMAGQLISFPGYWWHGVTAVTNGNRYTCPSWYSKEAIHEDRFLKSLE